MAAQFLAGESGSTWSDIVKNLAHHPRTEIVPLPSGCSLVPNTYTRLQRSFLDLVEAARHLRQAARCLRWSWLGLRDAAGDPTICCIARFQSVAGLRRKEGCNASCAIRSQGVETRQVKTKA
jgi:hypothetical protein